MWRNLLLGSDCVNSVEREDGQQGPDGIFLTDNII